MHGLEMVGGVSAASPLDPWVEVDPWTLKSSHEGVDPAILGSLHHVHSAARRARTRPLG